MENLLKYPQSCVVDRVVPKTMFYKFMEVNPRMKTRFTGDVVSITWLYKLSAATMNVTDTEQMKEIEVFVAQLKQPDCPPDLFSFIDQNMPHHIVFVLLYDDKAMLLINYKQWVASPNGTPPHQGGDREGVFKITQSFTSPWVSLSDLTLSVDGQSLPRIYDNFVAQVSGIGEHKAGAMAEIVELRKKIAAAEAELKTLQAKVRKESQFNVQMEMNKRVKAKRKELDVLKQELNTLL